VVGAKRPAAPGARARADGAPGAGPRPRAGGAAGGRATQLSLPLRG
jgi:hypothetical protein